MNSATVFAGRSIVDLHHERRAHDAGDRHGIALEIEIELAGIERRVDGDRGGCVEQRVAVGRRVNKIIRSDIAAGAGAVLDDEVGVEPLRQPLAEEPRIDVGGRAWPESDFEMHRTRRIGVGAGDARRGGKGRSTGGKMEKATAREGHGVSVVCCWLTLTCFRESVERCRITSLRGAKRRSNPYVRPLLAL